MLTVEVGANVTERRPYRKIVPLPFEVPFRGQALATTVNSFDIHEMLATKLRALFQRKKGRDLFDLYWALTEAGATSIAPADVIAAFQHYMTQEGTEVRQGAFLAALNERLADSGFCSDMRPLLRTGLTYDPQLAGRLIQQKILAQLPE